jgi:hypothetical protein
MNAVLKTFLHSPECGEAAQVWEGLVISRQTDWIAQRLAATARGQTDAVVLEHYAGMSLA